MAEFSLKSISFQSATGANSEILDSSSERLEQFETLNPTHLRFSRRALVNRFAMVLRQSSDLTGLALSQPLMEGSGDAGAAPTITDVVKNLLSPSTLPHILLLAFAGSGLYLLSASESPSLFAMGIAGYIGLSIGYALTAWMQEMNVIHRFSHFQPIEQDVGFVEKLFMYFIRIAMCWISPLLLGLIPFILITLFLSSESGQAQADYWAMTLAGLFVLWSLAQGRALATSLRIFVEGRAVRIASVHRNSKRFTSTSTHMGIIAIFAAATYWALVSGASKAEEMSFFEKMGPVLFALVAVAIQVILFKYTTERRVIDSERKDTAAFGFAWGLLMQLFVTWHLLSALRRFLDDSWGLALVIEEFILMLVTVIAAIWSLAKTSHTRGFKMFTRDNAVFWGLSFGIAYSGSIAMISVLGAKITSGAVGTIGMSTTIGIGHLITAGTMMWIHSWRIGQLARWLDTAREELDVETEDEVVPEDVEEKIEEPIQEEIALDIPPPVTTDDEVELVDLD